MIRASRLQLVDALLEPVGEIGDPRVEVPGSGEVRIRDWITLRDPDHRIPCAIVTEGSRDRGKA